VGTRGRAIGFVGALTVTIRAAGLMDCTSCGRANRPGARFCDACGTSLVARAAEDAVARKVVTIVFADLVGSTSLHERLDAESARRLMDRYYRALHAVVEAHGGTIVKLLGDGVMAAFGVPRVAEDDAIRAVRAGVGMQRAVRDLIHEQSGVVRPVGLRVGVNTGEVVVRDDQTDVVGDPVNVAARLQQEAEDGDVLIGESTQRLVGELVTLAAVGARTLKGRAETVAAYRVLSLDRPAGATATAFVGRDEELGRVTALHDAAVAGSGPRLAVILGSPGLGKSRLLAEIARRLADRAMVLIARCDAAGGATFAPLAGALRTLLDVDDGTTGDRLRAAIDAVIPRHEPDRTRITGGIAALLAGTPAPPEETFFVVRRLIAALATRRPVVLSIDDLQWAEPLLLDLTEHLVRWSSGVPLLVLAAARPELRDTRASLTTAGGLVSDVITLGGLDAGAATRLAANVVGADALPAAVTGRVLATSEGNPLFVGELVRMLVHDGALKCEGGRWTTGVEPAALEMPPTIHALLAARIERLGPEDRTVLERAAVVGRQFSQVALGHLLSPELRVDLDARLEGLRRSELIEPDTGWFLGAPALRFHHGLIRDAAYRRLLKETRAELHGRFAEWVESRTGEGVEQDETIGWHFEQAHQHLRELGTIDERGRAFGDRAARYLGTAGRQALARDDLPRAANLLGRALDRLDEADPARAELAVAWCEALLAAGDVAPAARAVAELRRFAGDSDRLRAWHTCFAAQLAILSDPQALRAAADALAGAANELVAAGDAAGEAKAHSVRALALGRLGEIGACEAELDRALAAARRARDARRENAALAGAPLAALWGPSPVTRASGRCLDVVRVLRITQSAPAVEAEALRCQAVLEALRGRADAARRMIASSRRMVEELGITHRLLEADVFAGLIELLQNDAPAAERHLRAAYDGLRSHGLAIDAAQAAALLGRALLAQGRAAEAETVSHESEALAGDDLKAAIAWRGVRAEALARRGEHAAAVGFARTAVDLAATTDALLDHADARLALAAALRAAGRNDDAAAEEARAIELWEAKGATLLAARAPRNVRRAAVATGNAGAAAADVPLATLGDALALYRTSAAAENDGVLLVEIDAQGQRARTEVFATDRLGAAITRLYERYAELLPDGVARVRAAATARSIAALMAPPDVDRYASAIAPAIEIDDRRSMGLGSGQGADVFLRALRSLLEMSGEIATRVDDIVRLRPEALLMRWTNFGTDRAGGGAYERPLLLLWIFGRDGRLARFEQLDADRDEDAVARLDELTAEAPATPASVSITNAATRTVDRFRAMWAARDWTQVGALFPAGFRCINRRRTLQIELDRERYLALLRPLFDMTSSQTIDVLATRGERLALVHVRWKGADHDVGPSEIDGLGVNDVDERGDLLALVLFDRDDLESAYAELDARYDRGEASRHQAEVTRVFRRAFAARDWDALAATLAPDLVVYDHRILGWETLRGPAQYIQALRSLIDLAPDARLRIDHIRMSDRGALYVPVWVGTHEGGAFETPSVFVAELDDVGRIRRFDQYDLDALGTARARFERL
jgi:class 3 adenylate cyclase